MLLNVGGASLPHIYDLLFCCLYIDVKEYYLSEFKVLFLIYGELIVSETKHVINSLKCQLSRGDCSYSLCIRAININDWLKTSLINFAHFADVLSFKFLNVSLIAVPEELPSKSILFSKNFNGSVQKSKQNAYYVNICIDIQTTKQWTPNSEVYIDRMFFFLCEPF